ncbi:IclR family transcriptional regulator [Bordetella hinzii]|jgi:DNA-binding IclR family transcriptional regulator|nr:IclR family transcriptional regulator [Bordetella hinzii]AKQ57909.1 HTH-type transcriptional regulator KipR [Bordetella hinzii]AKQ62375.1 HTH-type transcriptional regulator KipR [Bordetella hinzii]KCB25213.1 transcriptional regulator, IclR family, C-terminal domain protein [Bordetella hinzii OH87 BAL007II]KCB27776.1 transcriptional regulator, IclR family, C-terminal domain protein [Bordetella hinzii L60]KCB33269.1 transcriptional regulator, IclR family, C-terminal domain protein [Bordetella
MTARSTEPGVIERSVQLLKLLATAGRRGLALTQLAKDTEMAHSTVHRLLQQLMQERLVVQRETGKRYALGPLAFELGLAAAASFDLREHCRAGMQYLAEELGDTVYLSVRSGTESVCQAREEGPSPIRVNTLSIGSRRPLGLGAGGLAILSYLPQAEYEEVMTQILPRVRAEAHLDEDSLRASVLATRRQGYAFIRNRVTLGVTAIGVPIFDSLDRPIAAISIAAIDERMRAGRIATLAMNLQQQAQQIGRVLAS